MKAYFEAEMQTRSKHGIENASPDLVEKSSLTMSCVRFLHSDDRSEVETQADPSRGLIISIQYEKAAISPLPVVLDTLVRDKDGILFQASNHTYGERLLLNDASGTIELILPDLRAQNDVLEFAFTIWDEPRTHMLSWRRGFRVPMSGLPLSTGRSAFCAHWRVSTLPSLDQSHPKNG